jgi:hypothetical protein
MIRRSAMLAAGYLFGGAVTSFALALPLNAAPLPLSQAVKNALSGAIVVGSLVAIGAVWAGALTRSFAAPERHRARWAGALSFGPTLVACGILLATVEAQLLEPTGRPAPPMHQLYTLLFVPAAFVIAGVTCGALSWALHRHWGMVGRTAAVSGAAAAAAFLVVDLVMDATGWRVGAPGAGTRATMLVVTAACSLAAAVAGGAALGQVLGARPEPSLGGTPDHRHRL